MTSRTRRAFSACDRVVLRTPKAMLIVTHPGEAGVFLKDHPDAVRDLAADRTPLEFDHALRCLLQPRNQLHQSRLAAARRPDDREKFALLEIEIERSQRVDRFPSFACREDLGDTAYGYDGHAALPLRLAGYFGVLMSSGRKRVSIIFARSMSPLIAPTIFCTSTMRFMPSRWNCPLPQ